MIFPKLYDIISQSKTNVKININIFNKMLSIFPATILCVQQNMNLSNGMEIVHNTLKCNKDEIDTLLTDFICLFINDGNLRITIVGG